MLQEIRNVVAQHVVNGLYHFGFELLELVNAVTAQDLPEVIHIREVPLWQMELSLNL